MEPVDFVSYKMAESDTLESFHQHRNLDQWQGVVWFVSGTPRQETREHGWRPSITLGESE